MSESELILRLAEDLLALGVRPGGVLLAHASLRSLGSVPGGPETVIQGLIQVLGADGSLLMPALSYESVTPRSPVFDVLNTPCDVGLIPESFRTRPGTRRSIHPTHSVCGIGRLAATLLGSHLEDHTPCGEHSPFHLLPQFDGQILMLGCGLRPNTSMHAIEELVEPPYLFGQPMVYQLKLADGREVDKTYRQHGFAGWIQRYDRVEELMRQPAIRVGKVLEAEAFLLEAKVLWSAALRALRRDPLTFVDRAG